MTIPYWCPKCQKSVDATVASVESSGDTVVIDFRCDGKKSGQKILPHNFTVCMLDSHWRVIQKKYGISV